MAEAYTGQKRIPKAACVLTCADQAVVFTESDQKNGRFKIEAYDGGISKHWYWGNFAIDLGGLSFESDPLPVLDSHFTDRRVGVTTSQSIAKQVTAEGRFLSNPAAQEMRTDMVDGFPMQASLAGKPRIVEQVEDGATAKVNGLVLKGPGAIWRESTIYELSICPFGALKNTRSQTFAAGADETFDVDTSLTKETIMSQESSQEMTPERLKTEFAAVHASVFKAGKDEGIADERKRFSEIRQACGDDAELAAQCFDQGKTQVQALMLRNERLSQELANANQHKATKRTETATTVDPAIAEFTEQVPPPAGDNPSGPATFMEAVNQYMAKHKVDESTAVSQCVDLHPELHEAMCHGDRGQAARRKK